MERYLTSVREVELVPSEPISGSTFLAPRSHLPIAQDEPIDSLEQLGDYLHSMYDIIVLAFQTDLTRVARSTGNEGTGPAVPEIGVERDRHSLSPQW